MEATQEVQRPINITAANGFPNNVRQDAPLGWNAFPAMRRPAEWDPSLLDNRDATLENNGDEPLRRLDIVPATRPWTERDDQWLFDASLRGDGIAKIAQDLRRGYEETNYRIRAHSSAMFIDSKLPARWTRPYFAVLNELRRNGDSESRWTEEEEEELMRFALNGHQWINPLVFEDDRTAEGLRFRLRYVTGPVEPYRSRFAALKRREEREFREFQDGMSDREWMELGLAPPGRRVEERVEERVEGGGNDEQENGVEAGLGGRQDARAGWHDEVGEHGVVVVLDD